MMCVNALFELFGFTDTNANANDLKLQILPAGNANFIYVYVTVVPTKHYDIFIICLICTKLSAIHMIYICVDRRWLE